MISCSPRLKYSYIPNSLYFYFDDNNELMKKNYSGYDKENYKGIGNLKYNFMLDSINLIFIAKDKAFRNNPERIKILSKDTAKLNVKDFKWLNKFTSNWRNIVELRRSDKQMYIIEKDSLDKNIYLINVVYIEEIE